jgi:ATP-binding cassette subfamily B protein
MPTDGLLRTVVRLWAHLSVKRRRQFAVVIGLVAMSALAEVASVGMMLPFLGALVAPDRLFRQGALARVAARLGLIDARDLILPLALGLVVTIMLSAAFRLLVLWVSNRLAFATSADLSAEVYRRTLHLPYDRHLRQSSSEVVAGITHQVGDSVTIFNQLLALLSAWVLLLSITGALLVIDPAIAVGSAFAMGGGYWVIMRVIRRRLQQNSARTGEARVRVIRTLQESLGGVRDVLLDGTQDFFLEQYRRADLALKRAQSSSAFLSASPRFLMEALAITLLAAIALLASRQPGGAAAALPSLGALALGAQRLLPVLHQAFGAWGGIVGRYDALHRTLELLGQPDPPTADAVPDERLGFESQIRFESVRFRYARDAPWVLDGVTFTIEKGTRFAIVGRTGSGKSTLLDLLLGLLVPTEGTIRVDGEPLLGARLRAWQRSVAHVPQNVYLIDAPVSDNIVFGTPAERADPLRLQRAAHRAQVDEFAPAASPIDAERAGEHGIRFSAGQRQRIGIARALYKQASVLILDEATSALDTVTEAAVMRAIRDPDASLTVIMIAHRISTVTHCDSILELGSGRVIAQGSFDELVSISASFRRMAQA